jgi:hypothetical protein
MLWHMKGLNTEYDDMNMTAPPNLDIDEDFAFSSNRLSEGNDYSIVRASISGRAEVSTANLFMADSPLTPSELSATQERSESFMPFCDSAYDERGPMIAYEGQGVPQLTDTALITNPYDPEGRLYHYFFDSNRPSAPGDASADRDIYYYNVARNPLSPQPVAFNSPMDDAYPSLINLQEGILFSSNREGGMGGWDIYLLMGSGPYASIGDLAMAPAAVATAQAALNSTADDICPSFLNGVIVFASNRGGADRGYDLYYSIQEGAGWTAPQPIAAADVNFGILDERAASGSLNAPRAKGIFSFNGIDYVPELNSASNEFRPVLIRNRSFGPMPSGVWLIFSSDRSIPQVSLGGYDLYLAWLDGVDFPDIDVMVNWEY